MSKQSLLKMAPAPKTNRVSRKRKHQSPVDASDNEELEISENASVSKKVRWKAEDEEVASESDASETSAGNAQICVSITCSGSLAQFLC